MIRATHPGRFGDLLWACPTLRALAEASGAPVELVISAKYGSLGKLLEDQPYIGNVIVDHGWLIQESAPITPRTPPGAEEGDVHLGYEGWPEPTLAEDVYRRTFAWWHQIPAVTIMPPLDLQTPWISTPTIRPVPTAPQARPCLWLGWSEEHFELKVGITVALAIRFPQIDFWWLRPWGGRYDEVDHTAGATQRAWEGAGHALAGAHQNVAMVRADWVVTAGIAQSCRGYLGCLSSQWVLANALGIPAIVVEPNPHRWNKVFWQDGGGRNRMVLGNDGDPTFDVRHIGDAVQEWLVDRL